VYVVCQTQMRIASKPWTIVAAGGTTDVVYAGTYTGIETMIGVTAIATGEIATGIENWRLSGKGQRAPYGAGHLIAFGAVRNWACPGFMER
jgi:hypothetical protein